MKSGDFFGKGEIFFEILEIFSRFFEKLKKCDFFEKNAIFRKNNDFWKDFDFLNFFEKFRFF